MNKNVRECLLESNVMISSSQPIQISPVFTEPEAASWLKVSRVTLQRIRLRGEISFCRVGGCRVIYTSKHLEEYLASRERAAFHLN